MCILWPFFSTSPSPLLSRAPVRCLSSLSPISRSTIQTFSFLFPLSCERLFPFPKNLVQPSAFLLAARHWQMSAWPAHWRAVAPTDNVNRLWIRKVRHDVPGRGTLGSLQYYSRGAFCRRGGIKAHCWNITTHTVLRVYLSCCAATCWMNDQMRHVTCELLPLWLWQKCYCLNILWHLSI